MIPRVRMARKRLVIAREREMKATEMAYRFTKPAIRKANARYDTLRAIERRKDRIT